MSYALLIPAAGKGERLGSKMPKALVPLHGRPLIWWVLEAFAHDERLAEIVIASSSELEREFQAHLASHPLHERLFITNGGRTRQDSVGNALAVLMSDVDHVLVHDAARPLVTRDVINNVLTALDDYVAAVPGVPVTDTIKRVTRERRVAQTLERSELCAVQTPQGIRTEAFRAAHDQARRTGVQCTDDVALIEHFQLGDVIVVDGDPHNFKVTLPHDLSRAAAMLGDRDQA
ncbi:MAG: 2-C-methyl-D-erythritol 4-phosphate cytidylyltransferase [bacterium]|nr:2-C-methyl-D-erythritol 4-phosphate cytidylyltransferase [bacterium]